MLFTSHWHDWASLFNFPISQHCNRQAPCTKLFNQTLAINIRILISLEWYFSRMQSVVEVIDESDSLFWQFRIILCVLLTCAHRLSKVIKKGCKLTTGETLLKINSWVWQCYAENGDKQQESSHYSTMFQYDVQVWCSLLWCLYFQWEDAGTHVTGQMEDCHWIYIYLGGPIDLYHAPGYLRQSIPVAFGCFRATDIYNIQSDFDSTKRGDRLTRKHEIS